MTEHRIKDDTRFHAHHGNKPAIIKLFTVHLQIGKHIYCRLKEKSLFASAAYYLKSMTASGAFCNAFEFMLR